LAGVPPVSAREQFLRPDALRRLGEVNTAVSPTTSAAIHWAMALHPDQRPPTANHFRRALRGEISPPTPADSSPSPNWREAFAQNRTLLLACALLFMLALLLSFASI
jgi:eukaryotic-like serine/threonine-protein kinase